MNSYQDSPRILRRTPKADLARLDGSSPLLARLYATRVARPEDLTWSLNALPPPDDMPGIASAAERLARAIQTNEPICVFGDYDVDGATATAVCVRALRAFGHKNVRFFVPDRVLLGYGLTPGAVDALADPKPALILTVDNGIASLAGVRRAREIGAEVIITDHHLPGDSLPDATAIVNPNLPGSAFPTGALAGVGVAFYVMIALRSVLRDRGWFAERQEPNLTALLDLVALGTVADVVTLDKTNRILVEQGLRRIRAGYACPGIAALAQAGGCDTRSIVSSDFGFRLGPRLNAAGRLESMTIGIECLLSENPAAALAIARRLDSINRERQELQRRMRSEAEELAQAQSSALGDAPAHGLCLFSPQWHEGIVGLVAGRLKEKLHRPVAAFAAGSDGNLKGSVRSIPGVHIRDVLARIDAETPGTMLRFGGHAMAAGLTLPLASLAWFRDAFEKTVAALAPPGTFSPVLETDGALAPAEMTLESARILRYAGPWGQGFPEPLFDGSFEVREVRWVGDGRHAKLRVRAAPPSTNTPAIDAIYFNAAETKTPISPGVPHLAYRLDVNRYHETDTVQLTVTDCLD